MEVKERVEKFRRNRQENGYKTIEVCLTADEVAILDAIALDSSMSRVLVVSQAVKTLIYNSRFFLINGKLMRS